MSDIDTRLTEISTRRTAANRAAWTAGRDPDGLPVVCNDTGLIADCYDATREDHLLDETEQRHARAQANAEFIAHAHDDVRWLLEQVEDLTADRDAWRSVAARRGLRSSHPVFA
jgi:hypothetical protein